MSHNARSSAGDRIPKRRKVVLGEGIFESDGTNLPAVDSPMPSSGGKSFTFKDPNFTNSNGDSRKKAWKSLKQIISAERSLAWKDTDATYSSLDAPPSFKPSKHYSDLSGLATNYKDPQTGLYYATGSEFSKIRQLPYEIIQGYLGLRSALPQQQ